MPLSAIASTTYNKTYIRLTKYKDKGLSPLSYQRSVQSTTLHITRGSGVALFLETNFISIVSLP